MNGSNSNSTLTVGEAKRYVAIYLTSAIVAILVNAATIILIVATKSYSQFIHRLKMYLAIAGLLYAIAIGLEVLPVNLNQPDTSPVALKERWDLACVWVGAVAQYCGCLNVSVVFWTSMYVFVFVTTTKRLQQSRLEAKGVLIIMLVPLLFTWEPFIGNSYGLLGTTCWISGDPSTLGSVMRLAVGIIPTILATTISLGLLAAASVRVILVNKASLLTNHLYKTMREILPLILYPAALCTIFVVRIIIVLSQHPGVSSDSDAIFVALVQVSSIFLLVSLFLHSDIRRVARCRPRASSPDNSLYTSSVSTSTSAFV